MTNNKKTIDDFELFDHNGKPWRLSEELASGPLALLSYRGKWCPFCIKSWHGLRKAEAKFVEAGVRIVGITNETPEVLKVWRDRHNLPFTFLSDPEMIMENTLGIATTKSGHPMAPFLQPSFIIIPRVDRVVEFYWASQPGLLNIYGAAGRPSTKDMLNHVQQVVGN